MAYIERCSVDRAEGDILVLISDGGREYHLNKSSFNYKVNDIVDLTVEDGRIISCALRPDERDRRIKENRARLSSLFSKGKK